MSLSDFIRKIHLPSFKFPAVRAPSIFIVLPQRKPNKRNGSDLKNFKYEHPLILDTSAIIDGRIADIAKSGFLEGTFILSDFILQELQTIADSKNDLKRARGRFGLEVLENLKNSKDLGFRVISSNEKNDQPVDQLLIRLAKKIKAKIITVDYNLNKLGKISNIKILNINELANLIKTVVIPGEALAIRVVQEGKEAHQGVGYLPDGTMVVVEQGREYLGKEVETVVERFFQTEAGRMIFVKLKA